MGHESGTHVLAEAGEDGAAGFALGADADLGCSFRLALSKPGQIDRHQPTALEFGGFEGGVIVNGAAAQTMQENDGLRPIAPQHGQLAQVPGQPFPSGNGGGHSGRAFADGSDDLTDTAKIIDGHKVLIYADLENFFQVHDQFQQFHRVNVFRFENIDIVFGGRFTPISKKRGYGVPYIGLRHQKTPILHL
jgi:hypothetical protein